MHGAEMAGADELADDIAVLPFERQIDRRRSAFFAAQNLAQIDRLAEVAAVAADEQDHVIGVLEGDGRHVVDVRDEADAADGRGRQDALAVGLVVERDIARDDGEGEHGAGFRQAFDGVHELAHDLGPLRVAEVEVVGDGDGVGANRRKIAPAFGDRLLGPLEGIGLDIARCHVGRDGDGLLAADTHDARVTARDLRGVGADQAVILLPHPAP